MIGNGGKSYGIGMGEAAATGNLAKFQTLVSGGAGDCIIIGVHNPVLGRIYMIHAHRLTDMTQVIEQIQKYVQAGTAAGNLVIHLASQVFGHANAAHSGLVQGVTQALTGAGFAIAAQHNSSSLSVTHLGVFTPGANAAAADRPANDQQNAVATADLKILDFSLVPSTGGKQKSKESPN